MNNDSRMEDPGFDALEAMLAHIHPKQDIRSLTDVLRKRFVTLDSVLYADAHLLKSCGVSPRDALLISQLRGLMRHVRTSAQPRRIKLNNAVLAGAYLKDVLSVLNIERFHMLCLDDRGYLKENVFLSEGTQDASLFNFRKMLSEVMRISPGAVVISHNHPMHTLRPSQEDIGCTLQAMRALTAIGVPLLDHIIIAGETAVSLRENGFVPAHAWLAQAPENTLLKNWLKIP